MLVKTPEFVSSVTYPSEPIRNPIGSLAKIPVSSAAIAISGRCRPFKLIVEEEITFWKAMAVL